ncbi:hypothetical protein [Deinococcus aquaticus]
MTDLHSQTSLDELKGRIGNVLTVELKAGAKAATRLANRLLHCYAAGHG